MSKKNIFLLLMVCLVGLSSVWSVQIQWFGQAAFLFTAKDGTKIITDPYEPKGFGGAVNYSTITIKADGVTVSHDHADHNDVSSLPGKPSVIKSAGYSQINNVSIQGIESFHDDQQGKARGKNLIFVYSIDSLRICHLGDLGQKLTQDQIKQILKKGPIDVLLIPAGGVYTLDSSKLSDVIAQINPRITIPMHYKTDQIKIPLRPVDDFLKSQKNVTRLGSSTLRISNAILPASNKIYVLIPSN